jgi:uncharacterized protein (DUF983 family)
MLPTPFGLAGMLPLYSEGKLFHGILKVATKYCARGEQFKIQHGRLTYNLSEYF